MEAPEWVYPQNWKKEIVKAYNQYNVHLELIYRSNLFPQNKEVNLYLGRIFFWFEKILIMCDFFQLMGLLWITANPWPIPFPMVKWTQWFCVFNLDYFSLVPGGSLNGETNNISISRWGTVENYAPGYSFPIVFLMLCVVVGWYIFEEKYCSHYGKRWDVYRSPGRMVTLLLVNILYLPLGIAVTRMYYCEEVTNPAHAKFGTYVLAADYSMRCWTGEHVAWVFFYTLFAAPIMVGFPYLLYQYNKDNVVYAHPGDHEKRLQTWEITYMMGIDSHWIDNQVWITASHTRAAAYYRSWMTTYKLALLILSVSIRGDGTNGAEGGNNSLKRTQSALYWLFTVVFLFRFIFYNRTDPARGPAVFTAPYREKTSNVLFYILCAILFANTTISTSNAWGVVNAITINSNQTILLSVTTFGGMTAFMVMFGVIFSDPFTLWPSNRTLHRIQQNPSFAVICRRWIRVLFRADDEKMYVLTTPPEIADVHSYESAVRGLRSCWLEARYKGSIFELILQERLEEMIYNHALRLPTFYRKREMWDQAYQEAVYEKVFEKRAALYRLMAPKKRRVLTKLLSLRMMQESYAPTNDDFYGAFQDSGIKEAEGDIAALEKRTVIFLDSCRRQDKLLPRMKSTLDGDGDSGRSVLQEGDEETLQKRQTDVEELLGSWEQIVDALEEGLDGGDLFAKKVFSGDKLERWYGYRDQLMELLADCKAKLHAAGLLDPALSTRQLESTPDAQIRGLFDAEFDDEFHLDDLLQAGNTVQGEEAEPYTQPPLEVQASGKPLPLGQDSTSDATTSERVAMVEPEAGAHSDSEDSVGTAESMNAASSEEEEADHYRLGRSR